MLNLVAMDTLKKQSDFFDSNIESLIAQYGGKVLVVSSGCDVNAFSTFEEAYAFGVATYGLGNFLMRECKREEKGKVHIITPCVILV